MAKMCRMSAQRVTSKKKPRYRPPSIWPVPAKRRPLGWLDRLLTGLVVAAIVGVLVTAVAVNAWFRRHGAALSWVELRGLAERSSLAWQRLRSLCPSEESPLSPQEARLEDEREIQLAAERHRFPRLWLQGLVQKLSGFQRCQIQEPASAGLLQVTPAMQAQTGLQTNPFVPHKNLDIGLRYLLHLRQKTGSWSAAIEGFLQEAKPWLSRDERRAWVAGIVSDSPPLTPRVILTALRSRKTLTQGRRKARRKRRRYRPSRLRKKRRSW